MPLHEHCGKPPESLTELTFNGVYTRTAPVMRVGDVFYTHEKLFGENGIDDILGV